MTAFVAIWPDSTISVVSYPSGHDDETYEAWLFDDLDSESDPVDAKVYRLPSGFHLETSVCVAKHKATGRKKAVLHITGFHEDGKRPRRFEWSPDVVFKRINRWRMESRKNGREKSISEAIARHDVTQADYPEVPAAVFTIDEVRKMDSFAGVYIAVNKCTGAVQYVGKSKDVTKRVNASRPELQDCLIGLVRMEEQDIHFAEMHYIARCRPTHNKEGRASASA